MSTEELTSGYPDDHIDVPTSTPAHARSGFVPGGSGPIASLDLTEDVIVARPVPGTDDEPHTTGNLAGLLGRTDRSATPVGPARTPFTTFVVTDADRLLGTAFLLTGDRDRAEELLRTALAVAGATWTHRRSEPDADVLRAMARQYAGPPWWRERTPETVPLSGDIGAGLARLGSRHRVAIVLRYHQRCTEEETAAALGAPAGNVRSWISQALDQLGIDTRLDLRPDAGPGVSRRGLSTELARLAGHPQPPDPRPPDPQPADRDAAHLQAIDLHARLVDVQNRLPAQHRRERRRRAGVRTALAGASVAVIAAALALAGPVQDPILDEKQAAAERAAADQAARRAAATQPVAEPDPTDPNWFAFPTELAGDPLIASEIGGVGQHELELRFTPSNTNLAFTSFCRTLDGDGPELGITLNGHGLTRASCAENDQISPGTVARDDYPKVAGAGWSALGVRRGRESVLRLRLIPPQSPPTPKSAPQQRDPVQLGIAVYELSGPRVVSDGVIIKQQAEYEGHSYRLAGFRTAKITPFRRSLTLKVAPVPTFALVLAGMPTSTSTSGDPMLISVDGIESAGGSNRGAATFTLPDSAAHLLAIRARPDDTGIMLLAWYEPLP